jgi:hypothetical protein
MMQCEIEEETKTTVHIQEKEQLRCKMVISKENPSKASRAYQLRKFCGGGNSEPNDALKNVKCSEITSRLTRTSDALPVSKGRAKDKKNPHPGEGGARRRA